MSQNKKSRILKSKRKRNSTIKRMVRYSSKGFFVSKELDEYEEGKNKTFFSVVGKSAALNATNENKALGIPITYLDDNRIVTKDPTGKIIVEAELSTQPVRKFRKGTLLHVKK